VARADLAQAEVERLVGVTGDCGEASYINGTTVVLDGGTMMVS
jgi:hypothetical protein